MPGVQRLSLDKLLPVVFTSSKYAKRFPIGKPEIIQKAPRDAFIRYYKDWYRPDLMAVIVVGDIASAADIEKQISEYGKRAQDGKLTIEELARYPLVTYVFSFAGPSSLHEIFARAVAGE
ncbi:MAG: hypothetical protein HC793_04170 [Aquincola sp.]|nr:hypothetical protein [Aquincola sp.]